VSGNKSYSSEITYAHYFKYPLLIWSTWNRLTYIETSAATGQNVAVAIEILLDKIMLRMDQAVEDAFNPGQRGHTVQLDASFN